MLSILSLFDRTGAVYTGRGAIKKTRACRLCVCVDVCLPWCLLFAQCVQLYSVSETIIRSTAVRNYDNRINHNVICA